MKSRRNSIPRLEQKSAQPYIQRIPTESKDKSTDKRQPMAVPANIHIFSAGDLRTSETKEIPAEVTTRRKKSEASQVQKFGISA